MSRLRSATETACTVVAFFALAALVALSRIDDGIAREEWKR